MIALLTGLKALFLMIFNTMHYRAILNLFTNFSNMLA